MILADTARDLWHWGAVAALLTWLVGAAVSLVPILRTIVIFSVLNFGIAWWKAALFTIILQTVFVIADTWAMAADKRSLEHP